MKTRYIVVCLVSIMILSGYIRAFGFFNLDGSTKYPFLRNIDSFFFTRYTGLVLAGQTFDDKILAPDGGWFIANQPAYPSFAAFLYSGLNSLHPMPLEYFMAFLPIVFGALVVLPAYFIGKILWDKRAGLLSALFITLGTAFIARSLGGDPDSDAIAMLMFMLSILATLAIIKYKDSKIFTKKNIFIGVITGLVYAVFCYTWSGYWFSFVMMIAYIVLLFTFKSINIKSVKIISLSSIKAGFNSIKSILAVFLIAWFIFGLLVLPMGTNFPLSPITSPLSAGEHKSDVITGGMFPNVAVSIAEMQGGGNIQATLLQSNGNFGGLFIMLSPLMLTIAFFVFMMYRLKGNREHADSLLFLGIWFLLFVFASTVAMRFEMYLAPVYGFCSAIILVAFVDIAKKKGKIFLAGMFLAILFIISMYYILPAMDISTTSGPILNDNWWQALNWIKNNTADCAVIATYWDPGHFITGIANRSVIFDGTSQNALLLKYAPDICGPGAEGSFAVERYDSGIVQTSTCNLYTFGKNTTTTSLVTSRIKDVTIAMLTSNETLSVNMLKQFAKPDCDVNGSLYFLATSDLIGKATWWTYFATWDPTKTGEFPSRGRIYNYNTFSLSSAPKYMPQFNMIGLEYAVNTDTSIILCANNDGVVPCSNTTFALLKTGYQYVPLPGDVLPTDAQWRSILYIPVELKDSMFTRMFFYNGAGLNNFEFVKDWGNEVKLFRVNI